MGSHFKRLLATLTLVLYTSVISHLKVVRVYKNSSSSSFSNKKDVAIPITISSFWQNNPFSLRTGFTWQGEIQSINGFENFESLEYGVRAGLINLHNYYGLTIKEAIYIYCPFGDAQNNPDIYLSNINRITGINKNDILDDNNIIDLSYAIIICETGDTIPKNYIMFIHRNKI